MYETLDPYLGLLGSASYYLCDLPGSAAVLAKQIDKHSLNLDSGGLENLLLWLLQADLSTHLESWEGLFGPSIARISQTFRKYFEDGTGEGNLDELAIELRSAVYECGTPRQLLLGDISMAVLKKKLVNSSWKALPLYSGISQEKWLNALQKENFIRELWPAQHLMGQADVLKGKSAIVQMPTSAGKTKATELVLRSAFLSERTSLAIIIAPFRALCHEIKNSLVEAFRGETIKVDELSEALQSDFEIDGLLGHQQILVVTPEKLVYVLRHTPELASHAGLLIFDEGHQFDSGTRGITYELLLTSLRSMLPEETQKILISAVISNAAAVGEWLNGEPNVVEGTSLNPTFRSIGFASWIYQLGQIAYVDSNNPEQLEVFVPRVIETTNLGRIRPERKDRFFPEKTDEKAIALYLALKLVPNGSIAIFCGTKPTAAAIAEKVVDLVKRSASIILPVEYSDRNEVERLRYLYEMNIGAEASATKSAEVGIFSHHGNTPHGIRLSVEYAMRENLVRFVVCTSTLAQGVNLPIRYLLFTGVYQGIERIKVRDFHNLIGRAGRAGMHTEGSILFANPDLYDKRKASGESWRWKEIKELLEPNNSEPCISNLLSVFEPIKSDDGKYSIKMSPLDFVKLYINNHGGISCFAANIAEKHKEKNFTEGKVTQQVEMKISLICAIESFLLSHWDVEEGGLSESDVMELAEGTLAFSLANDEKRENIRDLFKLLSENISASIPEPARRRAYGKTLYGIQEAKAIEEWVKENVERLSLVTAEYDFLEIVWSLLVKHIHSSSFKKFSKKDVLCSIAQKWISGIPFHNLLEVSDDNQCCLGLGARPRKVKVDNIVDICESGLAFEGALLVGALCELIEMAGQDGADELISLLQLFQKRLQYGLPTATTIVLYELGFADRVIAQDLANTLGVTATERGEVGNVLKRNKEHVRTVVGKYPAYFQERFTAIL